MARNSSWSSGGEVVERARLAGVRPDRRPPGREMCTDVEKGRDLLVGGAELTLRQVGLAATGASHLLDPTVHRRACQAHEVGRGRRVTAGVDRGQGCVAHDGVVAVTITRVERHGDIRSQLLDDGAHLRGELPGVRRRERPRQRGSGHPGISVVEEMHHINAEHASRGVQLLLSEFGEIVGGYSPLPRLTAGRTQHCGRVPEARGMREDGSTRKRLVVRMSNGDEELQGPSQRRSCCRRNECSHYDAAKVSAVVESNS